MFSAQFFTPERWQGSQAEQCRIELALHTGRVVNVIEMGDPGAEVSEYCSNGIPKVSSKSVNRERCEAKVQGNLFGSNEYYLHGSKVQHCSGE